MAERAYDLALADRRDAGFDEALRTTWFSRAALEQALDDIRERIVDEPWPTGQFDAARQGGSAGVMGNLARGTRLLPSGRPWTYA